MGAETSTDSPPTASQTEPLSPTGLADGVKVDLTPHDIWVLGQLIEAETADFPPDVENDILNGYRILKGSGYEPPPTAGSPPNVDIVASIQQAPAQGEGLEAAPETSQQSQPLVREVLLAEVPQDRGPDLDAPLAKPRIEETAPPREEARALLDSEPLHRLADQVEELGHAIESAQAPAQAQEDDERAQLEVPESLTDLTLVGGALVTSIAFVLTAAIASDPVFAIFGLGIALASLWLAHPLMEPQLKEGPP